MLYNGVIKLAICAYDYKENQNNSCYSDFQKIFAYHIKNGKYSKFSKETLLNYFVTVCKEINKISCLITSVFNNYKILWSFFT